MSIGHPIVWVVRRVCFGLLVSSLLILSLRAPAHAHEVQPTVADITLGGGRAVIDLDWSIEAPVAGIDLEGLSDTNDAEGAELYDSLRRLQPDRLEAAFLEAWPEISQQFRVLAGDLVVPLGLDEVVVPEVGNAELPRISIVRISGDLPDGTDAVAFGWEAALGPLVVRQAGVENGYAAFLENGRVSDPIPVSDAIGQSASSAFAEYILAGFNTILPSGLAHILFALGLFFLAARLSPLLWQLAAFTLGYALALVLGALGIVSVPAAIVAPLIAVSIVYVGVENVLTRDLTPWRLFVVFGFGLFHGFGFARVLEDLGPEASYFVPEVAGFLVGIGIGLIAVITAAWLAFGMLFSGHGWYRLRIAIPVSIGMAAVALVWVFDQTGTLPDGALSDWVAMLTEGGMPVLWGAGFALAVMLLVTLAVFATDSDLLRDWGGFVTSLVAFLVVLGTFTALDYVVAAGLVAAWIIALRLQAVGGLDDAESSAVV